jgi:hypothetical protein
MMEALSSSEASVLTRATRRNIPEDAILLIYLGSVLRDSTRQLNCINLPYRNVSGERSARLVREDSKLTTICEPIF